MTSEYEDADLQSEEAFESLFSKAAPRPRPSRSHEHKVRQAVHTEWRLSAKARARRQRMLIGIAASTLVVASAAILLLQTPATETGIGVAAIEKQFGNVVFAAMAPVEGREGASTQILTGQIVQTGVASGMALRWRNGGSLRLDQQTRVAFTSPNEIYLHAGRLYFDSASSIQSDIAGQANGVEVLSIRTDRAVVAPLGTRYLTEIRDGNFTVAVREGQVAVTRGGATSTTQSGYRLSVASNGEETLESQSAFGDDWAWVEKTSPPYDTSGRSIYDFLTWVSRESGRSLHFDTREALALAKSAAIVGYGRVEQEPSAALRLVMLTTDLFYKIDKGVIVVTDRPDMSLNLDL